MFLARRLILFFMLGLTGCSLLNPVFTVANHTDTFLEDVQIVTVEDTFLLGNIAPNNQAKYTLRVRRDSSATLSYSSGNEVYTEILPVYLTRGVVGTLRVEVEPDNILSIHRNIRYGF